jgi:putative MATE family efflux protein
MGAAIATAIAHTVAMFIGLILVLKGRIPFRILPRLREKTRLDIITSLFKIGLPPSLASLNFAFVYLVMTRIMSQFGTPAVAAIPVGNRAESISYMTCFGFYIAASTMVGQNLGARQAERAARAAWTSLGIISAITFVYGVIFLLLSEQITSVLTNDIEVIKIAGSYLRVLAFSQVFMAFEFVLEGAFAGAGDTLPPMIVSIPGTLVRIPLAYLLAISLSLGPSGVFWAITISTIAKGTVVFIWFRSGSWKKQKI